MKYLRFFPLLTVSIVVFFLHISQTDGKERLFDELQLQMPKFSTPTEEAEGGGVRPSFDRALYGQDVEFYLGQRRQRNGSGGRVWTNIYFSTAVLHPKTKTNKIRPDIFGIQIGFDVVRSQTSYFSIYYNYNRTKEGLSDLMSSNIDNHFFGAGYFLYLSGCHFGLQGGLGYDQYKAKNDFGDGKGNGMQTNLFTEFGVDFPIGKWAIKPFCALQHDFVYHGRIGEAPNIIQSDWNVHGLNSLIGLRINWKPLENLEFQFRTTWIHELLDNPPPFYIARFSAVHGTSTPAIFHYQGNSGRDFAWLGIGMKWEFYYNAFLFIDYDAMVNKHLTSHLGNIGLCLGW